MNGNRASGLKTDTQVPLYMMAMVLTRRALQRRVTLGRPPTLYEKIKK